MPTKRTIKAEEIVKDLRAGMTDSGLMEKHRLSAWGLQDLFDQLLRVGLIEQSELDQRMSSVDSTVEIEEVLEQAAMDRSPKASETGLHHPWKCPACGTAQPKEPERCPNCGVVVSAADASSAKRTEHPAQPIETAGTSEKTDSKKKESTRNKRIVVAQDVIRDVKAGMTDAEFMAKYRLSARGLQSLFKKLVAAGSITKADLDRRPRLHVDTVAISGERLPARQANSKNKKPVQEDKDMVAGRLDRFRQEALKVGKVRAAVDARLTVEEICELWEQESQETFALVTEAWNRFDEMRQALLARKLPPH
jgi:uncharacterized protein (DUF433 family)/predicted Zn-ribbon and HTH transcriptional regulator